MITAGTKDLRNKFNAKPKQDGICSSVGKRVTIKQPSPIFPVQEVIR
jgi:hypothetical protein